jgi:hypothetical protein
VSAFTYIGMATVGLILVSLAIVIFFVADEAWRAYLQTCRMARARYGRGWRKRITARGIWRVWRGEFFDSYTTVRIGGLELPYDPRKSVRRWFPG